MHYSYGLFACEDAETLKDTEVALLWGTTLLPVPLWVPKSVLYHLANDLLVDWLLQLIHRLVRHHELLYETSLLRDYRLLLLQTAQQLLEKLPCLRVDVVSERLLCH